VLLQLVGRTEKEGETRNELMILPGKRLTKEKEEVLLVHLRLRYTLVMHGRLLRGDPAPPCLNCGLLLAVSHMILECSHCDVGHRTFNLEGTVPCILGDNRGNVSSVVTFLHRIGVGIFI
jgi:hypothetical protein